MLTMFLLAGLLTVALAGVAVLSLVCGGALWAFAHPPARGLVPYLLLVAPLGSLAAIAGAWGCGAALARSAGESPLPLWGWVAGLFAGGALGALAGFSVARALARRMSR
jgi:hypothetical protein